jgi:hypothetical protein
MAVANLLFGARGPHSLLLCFVTAAHQPSNGLGVPDQDASQGPNGPLGPLLERSI